MTTKVNGSSKHPSTFFLSLFFYIRSTSDVSKDESRNKKETRVRIQKLKKKGFVIFVKSCFIIYLKRKNKWQRLKAILKIENMQTKFCECRKEQNNNYT